MPSKPFRTSLSMPRIPWMSIPPSTVAVTERSWISLSLGDGRDAGGEAARQTGQHDLDRRRTTIFRSEDLGVVSVEGESCPVVLFLAQSEESLHGGATVGALDDLPPRVVPHPMLVPAPVEGREGRASSGTRATA